MKEIEFFDELEKVCPHQDIDRDEEWNMEPVQPTCSAVGHLACVTSFCPVVETMATITQMLKYVYKNANIDGMTSAMFFNAITSICRFRKSANISFDKKLLYVCGINHECSCKMEICPIIASMARYIVHIKKKLAKTEKPRKKTALEEVREKRKQKKRLTKLEKDGWIKVENKEQMRALKENDFEYQLTSVTRRGRLKDELEYYYKVIEKV